MKGWANTFEILGQSLTFVITASALQYWSADHSLSASRAHCTLLSGPVSWWCLSLFCQGQTGFELGDTHIMNHFDSSNDDIFAKDRMTVSFKCFLKLLHIYTQMKTCSPESAFVSRFPPQGFLWAPWWVPILCVSCADQSDELSWSLWCSLFFADTHGWELGHPSEPLEACISILLIPTNTQTFTVFSTKEDAALFGGKKPKAVRV